MSRLWEKGLPLDERVLRYTAGEDHILDARLVAYDVRGSIAHAEMLAGQGLISKEDCAAISSGLESLRESFDAGEWSISLEDEDVHTALESRLTQTIGEAGGRLHLGQSAVGAERRHLPAEARRPVLPRDELMRLAVILVRPHRVPVSLVVGRDHPAFTGGRDDLVLAKRKGCGVSKGANGTPSDSGPVCLGTILYYNEVVFFSERHDLAHFTRPAAKMDRNDRSSSR